MRRCLYHTAKYRVSDRFGNGGLAGDGVRLFARDSHETGLFQVVNNKIDNLGHGFDDELRSAVDKESEIVNVEFGNQHP